MAVMDSSFARGKDKTCIEILKDADPLATKEELEKYMKKIADIQTILKIEDDPQSEMVSILGKIESELNYLVEARNILYNRFTRMPMS